MLEEILKQIILEKKAQGAPKAVILNFLKEYIQYLVLNLIYNHKDFKKLVFKGGSCLRVCYVLPRLSEDLDFDYDKKAFKTLLPFLENFLSKEIKSKYFPGLETKIQSPKRIYLKFPMLYNLAIAQRPESNKLYVKIETENKILPYAGFELTPVSQFGFNFLAYHYDLPSLMATKINALLFRLWFKGKRQEVDIKGRDFYDLFWFYKNNVKPNWRLLKKITKIKNEKELKAVLLRRIKKSVTTQKLEYDLKNFLPEQSFVSDFSKNYLEIIKNTLLIPSSFSHTITKEERGVKEGGTLSQ